MSKIDITADLMLQSESGEIQFSTSDDDSLNVAFSDWSQLGTLIKLVKKQKISIIKLKSFLPNISNSIVININGKKQFRINNGTITSTSPFNWIPVIRYYLF